jgi:hypothetical protein
MVAATMAAAIDKTARCVLRTNGSANGIGLLFIGTGVWVRDRSGAFPVSTMAARHKINYLPKRSDVSESKARHKLTKNN